MQESHRTKMEKHGRRVSFKTNPSTKPSCFQNGRQDHSHNNSFLSSHKNHGLGFNNQPDFSLISAPLELFTGQSAKLNESKGVLQMQLYSMIDRALVDAREANGNTYQAIQKSTVSHVNYFCTALGVNPPIKFRALELYDRFVVRFNDEMYDATRKMEITEIESVKKRINAQGPLRMCSCIMLAAKLHSDTKTPTVTLKKIRDLLLKHGYSFSSDAVAKSEVRVLNTLNFRLHWTTAFDIVEQMISMINISAALQPKVYHYAMLILELSFLYFHDVYKRFWNHLKKTQSGELANDVEGETYKRKIVFNTPLRAAAIVASAVFVAKPEMSNSRICRELSELTKLSGTLISELSLLLTDLIIR